MLAQSHTHEGNDLFKSRINVTLIQTLALNEWKQSIIKSTKINYKFVKAMKDREWDKQNLNFQWNIYQAYQVKVKTMLNFSQ